jgi:outer membrane protein, heavy metal efflux system
MLSIPKLRRFAAALLLFGGLQLAAGCASTSIARDVASVRELAGMEDVPNVGSEAVDRGDDADVQALAREPLDADRAVRLALRNNHELRAQLRELGIGRGRLVQAGLIANPIVEIETLPERDTSYELRVEYEISSLILAPVRTRAAAAELAADRHAVASAVVHLAFDVRSAVYDLQRAIQRLALAREALEAFAASRDTAEQLLAAGNIAPIGAAAEVAAHERARVLVGQLETEVVDARERVQRLLGLRGADAVWEVAPALAGLPDVLSLVEQAESEAVRASHDLASMTQRRRAAATRTGLSRLQGWLPEITFDAHALHGRPESLPGPSPDESWRFGGGVSLRVPVFDRQQGATRAREAEVSGLSERIEGLELAIRSAVRAANRRRQVGYERARRYLDVIIPAQSAVMERTLLQYNAMQLSIFDLLRARREQLDVQLAYVDALYEYWSADAAFHALLNGTQIASRPRPSASGSDAGDSLPGDH